MSMRVLLNVYVHGRIDEHLRVTLPLLGATTSGDLRHPEQLDLILLCAATWTEAAEQTQQLRNLLTTAAIVISGQEEWTLQQTQQLFALGASIILPSDPTQMQKVLDHTLQNQRRIRTLINERNQLADLVDRDHLTGLFNMRSFYERLAGELARARRYHRQLSVLMLDVDNFKTVNDQHDHVFGSFVLSEVGRMLSENIRQVDFAARFGGDEFVVVLAETGLTGAMQFAERLRSKIAEKNFSDGQLSCHITMSLGLTEYNPVMSSQNDSKELVRLADQALYLAKSSGKNCLRSCLPSTEITATT